MKKLSICVPVYNVENYIEECIISIVNQEINGEYEIVCVDDCSTDNSLKVLYELASKFPQIKVIESKQNGGVSSARNTALKVAEGKYIWFIDGDDVANVGAANAMLEIAEAENADIVCGKVVRFYDSVPKIEESNVFSAEKQDITTYNPDALICNRIFRTSFLMDNDMFFREEVLCMEDVIFDFEISLHNSRFFVIDKVVYFYRLSRKGSIMTDNHNSHKKKFISSMCIGRDLINELKDGGMSAERRQRADKLIANLKQIAATKTVSITDKQEVKRQIKILKEKGMYPYKLRWDMLKEGKISASKLMVFLLPIKPCFWMVHFIKNIKK